MKENFVDYTIAKKLKDLGFDEPCLGRIYVDGGIEILTYNYKNSDVIGSIVTSCALVLYQQVLQFLREKYNIHISVGNVYSEYTHWAYTVGVSGKGQVIPFKQNQDKHDYFPTYQEALIKGIEESIKLIEINKL